MHTNPAQTTTIEPESYSQWILSILGAGASVTIPVGSRRLSSEIAKHIKSGIGGVNPKVNSRNVSRALYRLKKSGFVEPRESRKSIKLYLTPKGLNELSKTVVEAVKISKQSEWDKLWRMVVFDIPQTKRRQRDLFRAKLRGLGFCRFQQSVWLIPYPCETQINTVASVLGVSNYIRLFTMNIENDAEFRKEYML